jgi:CheY-like chemotaxis protein
LDKGNEINKSVLLVDDDETHLAITEVLLEGDYSVFKVKSGKEALDFLGQNHVLPDLILLDILMPSMDGWVVFDKINDLAALKFTPIMFYTSLDEESAREKAYELGAFDYVTKPCEQSILLGKIKDALQKAETRRQQYST